MASPAFSYPGLAASPTKKRGDLFSQSTRAGRRSPGLQTCTFSCIVRAVSPDWVSIVRKHVMQIESKVPSALER
jgi:hypothetical protein